MTFDMFSKISVKGSDQHPLYAYLTSEEANPETAGGVKWNFTKYLVDQQREGDREVRLGREAAVGGTGEGGGRSAEVKEEGRGRKTGRSLGDALKAEGREELDSSRPSSFRRPCFLLPSSFFLYCYFFFAHHVRRMSVERLRTFHPGLGQRRMRMHGL